MNIYVGNLNYRVGERSATLIKITEQHNDSKLMDRETGESKFAFIRAQEDDAAATKAIAELNGLTADRTMVVEADLKWQLPTLI